MISGAYRDPSNVILLFSLVNLEIVWPDVLLFVVLISGWPADTWGRFV